MRAASDQGNTVLLTGCCVATFNLNSEFHNYTQETSSNLIGYSDLIVTLFFFLFLKLHSTIPNANNYSEFELLPEEGRYDATNPMNQIFKMKVDPNVVKISADRDENNYCEIELEPEFEQYDTTFREQKDSKGVVKTPMPYDIEETYSELEPSLALTDQRGKKFIPPGREDLDPDTYSELELTLSSKQYDVTCFCRNRATLGKQYPVELSTYSDMEISTVENEYYDITTHRKGKANKERAKIFADNSATCEPETYSVIELTLTTSHDGCNTTKIERDVSASHVVLSEPKSITRKTTKKN